jgi:hypothetical protein
MKLKEIKIRILEDSDGKYIDTEFMTTKEKLPLEMVNKYSPKFKEIIKALLKENVFEVDV